MHPSKRTTKLETYVNPTLEKGQFAGKEYQILADLLVCPGCLGGIVEFKRFNFSGYHYDSERVFPLASGFAPAPPEVPANISGDFEEANLVLSFSPKASAALARRCLQSILTSHGYASKNLVKQVEAALNESDTKKVLPSAIRDNLDAIRNFGNFSAHAITDQTSLQVVDVEEGEAEWCLEILRDLFDHYYVSPAKSIARRSALDAKLAGAGKPPMK